SDDRGSAIALPGAGGVSLGTTPTLAGDFSIEVWVNAQPGARGTRYVITKGNAVQLYLDASNRPWFRAGGGFVLGPGVASGVWHQLVATVAGHGARLYVDGRLASSAALPSAPGANGSTLWLGRPSGSGGLWAGRLDELSFSDAALSDADVAARYAAVAD